MELAELMERFDCDNEPLIKMDGFDDCIVGVVIRYNDPPLVCYDQQKVIDRMMKDGMSEEEAQEFFEFNQLGAWVGPQTPCFLMGAERSGDD